MIAYIVRRLLLMIPTLFGILLLNFLIVQAAPGGPVERMVAELKGHNALATARFSSMGGESAASTTRAESQLRNTSHGLDPEIVARIEKIYGFDKPAHERFTDMLWNYLRFDFGESFFRSGRVMDLIWERLPVSISLGLWSTLLIYLISIPLGIRKAVRDGSPFDVWTSSVMIVAYAIPSFLFALLLIILFAGGSYVQWFPLRGLVSDHWAELPWYRQVLDYLWHITLPIIAMVMGGFASLTLLTKNSFMDEMTKQYVLTARAKGLNERQVLWGHVFRNAMLLVIASLPSALMGIFFTSALLIEVIFSLDGLGLLGFESAINRDYPVMFGTLYLYTLIGLFLSLLGDLTYRLVDPRIDFERR